ncbi:MAG: hypothetical protein IPO30_05775 [Hyphomonadaceae bacterium]|jgi:hypothetical protein|nr:hypothetical protein [Hyphomonadaceae bacterium]
MSRKTLITLALVLVPVAVMVLLASTGWLGGQFPNAHFVIAFALGATATVLLAVGLFALSFYSSRSGHDEQIGNEQDSDEA